MFHQDFAAQGFVLGLCYWLVSDSAAAAGTGGMPGLRQTGDRIVSNKSCGFYVKWMIWRSFLPVEACLFSAKGMRGWTYVGVQVWTVRNASGCWRGAEAEAPTTRVGMPWPVPVWAWTAHCCGDGGQRPLMWKAKCSLSWLAVLRGSMLLMAIVWGEGNVALTSSACFLFPWEMREKAGKYLVGILFVVCLLENSK